jgi:hypothetical protein
MAPAVTAIPHALPIHQAISKASARPIVAVNTINAAAPQIDGM